MWGAGAGQRGGRLLACRPHAGLSGPQDAVLWAAVCPGEARPRPPSTVGGQVQMWREGPWVRAVLAVLP